MDVRVDGTSEREPMSQGQIAGLCLGALVALAAIYGDTDPQRVASITAGAVIILISAAGPTTAQRLAGARRPPSRVAGSAGDLAEVEALVLRRFANVEAEMKSQRAELEGRIDAADARRSDLNDRFDHTMSVLGGIAQGFAQEADRLRKTS